MTNRENRALRDFMERACRQNPSIEAICDGLERSARQKLRLQGIASEPRWPFEPPAGASALVKGYYLALFRIHLIRNALEKRDAADAAHHAFFLGMTRLQVLLEQDGAVGKMNEADKLRAGRRVGYEQAAPKMGRGTQRNNGQESAAAWSDSEEGRRPARY